MYANELAERLYIKKVEGDLTQVSIDHLAQDSRKVKPNTLFFCVEGSNVDGHNYVKQAKEQGAVAFVARKPIGDAVGDTPVIYVDDVVRVMALFANHFYQYQTEKMNMIGVTGTNGKTTIAQMVNYLIETPDKPTAVIGTLGRQIGSHKTGTHNTTPEILTLHELFQELREMGGDTVTMEVSSHALLMGRVRGIDYDTVVFTNLTHEHMEVHKTMDGYAHAKSLLFSQIGNHSTVKPKVAILNADDPRFSEFSYSTPAEVISYGIDNDADFKASNIELFETHVAFDVTVKHDKTYHATTPMVGIFNVANALAAIAVAYVNGVSVEESVRKLKDFPGVPSRMQRVDMGQPFLVISDYAHTPDGMQKLMDSIKKVPHKRLILVTAHAGGNRDNSMRPELGRISFENADYVILTADNPRNEPLSNIYAGMMSAINPEDYQYECIDHRESAIERAIDLAEPGDLVLIAGKGHETYQIIGDKEYPYDEIGTIKAALAKRYPGKDVK